jgi:hypothetical protein
MTLAIFILFILPLALLVFACGVLCGLWLAGVLITAPPLIPSDFAASEGAKFADTLSRRN